MADEETGLYNCEVSATGSIMQESIATYPMIDWQTACVERRVRAVTREEQLIAAGSSRLVAEGCADYKAPARGTTAAPSNRRRPIRTKKGGIKTVSHPCMTLSPDTAAYALIPQSHEDPVWRPLEC